MRKLSLCLLGLSLFGLSACSSEPSASTAGQALANMAVEADASENAGFADADHMDTATRFQSNVPGLTVTAATSLPIYKGRSDVLCFDPAPQTRQGESVQSRGWQVTGEVDLGDYQLVSFVGKMEPGTSGSCMMSEGNVALFDGGDVKAIIHAKKGANVSIGSIQKLEPGNVRILDGDIFAQPLADLHIGKNGSLSLEKPAASESVCNGRGKVPNIYGMPINRARALLQDAGWKPGITQAPDESRARALVANGVTEVDACSGTGFGYCRFSYEGRAGKILVTTAGDEEAPNVVHYWAECSG